jgi:hypothetical protein
MQEIVFSYFLSGLNLQLRHKTAGVVCAVQSINSCGNAVARSSNKIMYKPTECDTKPPNLASTAP